MQFSQLQFKILCNLPLLWWRHLIVLWRFEYASDSESSTSL